MEKGDKKELDLFGRNKRNHHYGKWKIYRKRSKIKIDRELGSKHPKHGFIPNTISADDEELDCYLLGVFEPVTEYIGKCIAIVHRTNDNDDKLIIVPEGKEYSDDAINALVEFQKQYFKHIIIR